MASVKFDDITEWRDQPMHRLIIYNQDESDETTEFYHPRSDSTWSVVPIKSQQPAMYTGVGRDIGWMISVSFKLLINGLESINERVDELTTAACYAQLVLKAHSSQIHGRTATISIPPPADVSFAIDKGVLEIRVTGVIDSLHISSLVIGPQLFEEDTEPDEIT